MPSEVLGIDLFTAGSPRPYSHSLLMVGVLAACGLAAQGAWRRVLLGALWAWPCI